MPRAYWLVAAAVGFGLAAWLMWGAETEGQAARRLPSRWEFPRRQRKEDLERLLRRRTLPPRPALPEAGIAEEPLARDPVLVAMPPGAKSAMVIEASSVHDSALGRLILECFISTRDLQRLEALKQDSGIDLERNLDRVAVAGDVTLFSGDFSGARFDGLLNEYTARAYGRGTLYEPSTSMRRRRVIGVWGAGLLIAGRSAADVEQAIDRLEGRSRAEPPLDESDAYGEIYGVFTASELARLLPEETAARLRGTAERVELHVDTRNEHDVLIVADANGRDRAAVDDLGKSLGAALAVARVTARHDGDEDLAQLLDLARVSPETGAFRLEVGLPLELLRRRFGRCADDAGAR
jgi:hypothetical protein